MASQWFYEIAGKQGGPVTSAELLAFAQRGTVVHDTPVRKGADGKWVSAKRVRGLFPATNATSPSTPTVTSEPSQEPADALPQKPSQPLASDVYIVSATPASEEPSQFAAIGNIDAICPYCNQVLKKKPGRKKKCPSCSQFIYVRTRPSDKKQVLATEAQAEQIEEQWSVVNGTHDTYLRVKRRFAEEKTRLATRFGREPSDNDVQWGLLNQELLEHVQQRNWGLFRNTKFAMAEILRKENRLPAALGGYLEVCYLDLNGPHNTGGITDGELLREYPPWNHKDPTAELAPGILDRLVRVIEKANLTQVMIEKIYFKGTSVLHTSLRLPLSPTAAWPQIKDALFGEEE